MFSRTRTLGFRVFGITGIEREMLRLLKRWLGWEGESGLLDFAPLGSRSRSEPPPTPKPLPIVVQTRRAEQAPEPQRRAKDKTPLDVLDNPRLSLDKPADDGFDPYNTGAFNRSASWERIGRQRKR
jgi:hypothetical protein